MNREKQLDMGLPTNSCFILSWERVFFMSIFPRSQHLPYPNPEETKWFLKGFPSSVFSARGLCSPFISLVRTEAHLWDMGDNPEPFLVSSQRSAELILAMVDEASEICGLRLLVALEWVMPMSCDCVSCNGEEKILVPNILEQHRIGGWCSLGNGTGAKAFLQLCVLAGFISCQLKTHDSKVCISYSTGLCAPGAAPLSL